MEFDGEMRKQGTFEVYEESSNDAVGILQKEEPGQVKINIFYFAWHRDGAGGVGHPQFLLCSYRRCDHKLKIKDLSLSEVLNFRPESKA